MAYGARVPHKNEPNPAHRLAAGRVSCVGHEPPISLRGFCLLSNRLRIKPQLWESLEGDSDGTGRGGVHRYQ